MLLKPLPPNNNGSAKKLSATNEKKMALEMGKMLYGEKFTYDDEKKVKGISLRAEKEDVVSEDEGSDMDAEGNLNGFVDNHPDDKALLENSNALEYAAHKIRKVDRIRELKKDADELRVITDKLNLKKYAQKQKEVQQARQLFTQMVDREQIMEPVIPHVEEEETPKKKRKLKKLADMEQDEYVSFASMNGESKPALLEEPTGQEEQQPIAQQEEDNTDFMQVDTSSLPQADMEDAEKSRQTDAEYRIPALYHKWPEPKVKNGVMVGIMKQTKVLLHTLCCMSLRCSLRRTP